MDAILIRIAEESIANEVGAPMRDEAVAFHFSHAETAIAGAALKGLACQHGDGTTSSGVDLVVDLRNCKKTHECMRAASQNEIE